MLPKLCIILFTICAISCNHTFSDFLAGRSHEERTKELEICEGAMYAVPFRSATVAMGAVPRRGVYREWGEEKGGENEEKCEEPCPLRF